MRTAREYVDEVLVLTKARLASFVTLTALVGFLVAAGPDIDLWALLWTVLGTTFAAWGANAANQCWERERDALMNRTRHRPLPAGTLTLSHAVIVASVFILAGDLILAFFVNPLTALLALIIQVLYVLVYTPMKSRTPLNTMVGAVCGAIPPMMGWTAVHNSLDAGAWVLFLILFVWQMPHFLSLAWLYKEDYERGGFRMLPGVDRSGVLTLNLVVLYSAALLPLGLAATLTGLAGWNFFWGSCVLAVGLLVFSIQLRESGHKRHARRVFFASLAYLPVLLGLMVLDRGPAAHLGPVFRVAPDAVPAREEVEDLTPSSDQAALQLDGATPSFRTAPSEDALKFHEPVGPTGTEHSVPSASTQPR